MQLINKNEHARVAIYGWKHFCTIEVTLLSVGPLAKWGPGQIAPVAPSLGGPALICIDSNIKVDRYVHNNSIIYK